MSTMCNLILYLFLKECFEKHVNTFMTNNTIKLIHKAHLKQPWLAKIRAENTNDTYSRLLQKK